MWVYITRRLLYAIPIVVGVILLTFLIFFMAITPRELARQALGGDKARSENQIADWLRENGYAELNASGLEKARLLESENPPENIKITMEDTTEYGSFKLFTNYIGDLVTFDFGKNRDKRPISEILRDGMGPSLMLTIPIFLLSEIVGIFFALFAALYRNTRADRSLVIGSVILMSFSPVAMILFAQKYFAAEWNYFPISGFQSGIIGYAYLILPIAIYVFSGLGGNIRFNRILALDEVGQDYIRTAKAKGLHRNTVLFKHALRNIMIPLITHWSQVIPGLFLGSLLLESFFGIPGLGGITVQAVRQFDVNLIRALVFLGTILYIAFALLADILYAFADPRVKLK